MTYRNHFEKDLVSEFAGVLIHGAAIRWHRYIIGSTPTGSEQDTGLDLPAKGIVLPYVLVDVTTAEATGGTKTLDVGLLSSESGGDADGFLDGVSVATTGLKKGTLLSSGQTLGALLRVDESGAGVLVSEPHLIGAAKSITFTAGSNDFAEFRGVLYVPYIEIITD